MEITTQISQSDHDVLLAQLRKKDDGSDDLTVTKWLQDALNGKIYQCQKRANPEKVALKERDEALTQNVQLLDENGKLKKHIADLEKANDKASI